MTVTPTFVRWLAQQQRRNDPIGDLACETSKDTGWPHLNTNPSLRELAQYLHSEHGIDLWSRYGAARTLFDAYREWHDLGGRYRNPSRPIGHVHQRSRGVSLRLRFFIFQRDRYRCQICGRTAAAHGVVLEVDHKVAYARGGSNEPTNLWTVCFDCNRGKRDSAL